MKISGEMVETNGNLEEKPNKTGRCPKCHKSGRLSVWRQFGEYSSRNCTYCGYNELRDDVTGTIYPTAGMRFGRVGQRNKRGSFKGE